jgi:outer membrane receptor protein involved in Fe transport
VFTTPTFTQDSDSTEKRGESILRGTVRLPPAGDFSIETGAEAVYNWSEQESSTILNGDIFSLSGDVFQADELRSEAFGTLTWKPGDDFNAELGLRYEWSRITAEVSGEDPSEKTLSYLKPRLNVSWSPAEDHEFSFEVERVVDQLSFDAFASSASFENGVFGEGNPSIEPEKMWTANARYERQFGGQNSFVVELSHSDTEDVLSRVTDFTLCGRPPSTTPGREITCNYGEETRNELDISGMFELDRFGMKGGIVNLGASVNDSETVDPVTGETRRVSGENPYGWNFSLQQTLDNGNFRWALFLEDDEDAYNYSPRSVSKNAQLMFIGANISWKPLPGWTFGAGVNNILRNNNRSWSVFYSAPRDTGTPLYLEKRLNEGATNFFVNLRKNF